MLHLAADGTDTLSLTEIETLAVGTTDNCDVFADITFSSNYRWQSVLGRVYIIGTARTREERDIVEEIIRTTKGVSGATIYIRVR